MNIHNETCAALGIPESTRQEDVNPLDLALHYEFDKKEPRLFGKPGVVQGSVLQRASDYRNRAIDRCIKQEVSFASDRSGNAWFDMTKRFIKVSCPRCQEDMQSGNGSGAGNTYSMVYTCECGVSFSISAPASSYYVTFPEKPAAK